MGKINVQIRSERCREVAFEAVKRLAAVIQFELNIAAKNRRKYADIAAACGDVSRHIELFVGRIANEHLDITNDKDFNEALRCTFGYDATKL